MTFITPLCLTDVSSELLKQSLELKKQLDAQAAARENVNSKFCFKTIESLTTGLKNKSKATFEIKQC
jgi:hypothetical protein